MNHFRPSHLAWRLAVAACASLIVDGPLLHAQEIVPQQPPLLEMRVLQTRRVSLGDRSIIFNRVQPPVLRPQPEVPVLPLAVPTEEERQALEALQAKYAQKKRVALFISATVFNNAVTELYWTHNGRQCRAFSNINFNYFAGMAELETDDTVCWLLMAVVNNQVAPDDSQTAASRAQGDKQVPALSEFSQTRSEYIVVEDQGGPLPDEALVGIEALHGYFDANRARIIEEAAKREAAQAAREQWLKDHPPVPKDTVINFWPIKSRVYGNAPEVGESK